MDDNVLAQVAKDLTVALMQMGKLENLTRQVTSKEKTADAAKSIVEIYMTIYEGIKNTIGK